MANSVFIDPSAQVTPIDGNVNSAKNTNPSQNQAPSQTSALSGPSVYIDPSAKVEPVENDDSGESYGKFLARGQAQNAAALVSGAIGSVPDTINMPINAVRGIFHKAPLGSVTNEVRSGIDALTGGYTAATPDNKLGNDLSQFAGSMAGFGGEASAGAKVMAPVGQVVGAAGGVVHNVLKELAIESP